MAKAVVLCAGQLTRWPPPHRFLFDLASNLGVLHDPEKNSSVFSFDLPDKHTSMVNRSSR